MWIKAEEKRKITQIKWNCDEKCCNSLRLLYDFIIVFAGSNSVYKNFHDYVRKNKNHKIVFGNSDKSLVIKLMPLSEFEIVSVFVLILITRIQCKWHKKHNNAKNSTVNYADSNSNQYTWQQ